MDCIKGLSNSGSHLLGLRPNIRRLPEIMVCRIFVFMWPFGPCVWCCRGLSTNYVCHIMASKVCQAQSTEALYWLAVEELNSNYHIMDLL